jgi:hypothetical protein
MKYNLKFKFENPRLGDIGVIKAAHQNPAIFSSKFLFFYYIYIYIIYAL